MERERRLVCIGVEVVVRVWGRESDDDDDDDMELRACEEGRKAKASVWTAKEREAATTTSSGRCIVFV